MKGFFLGCVYAVCGIATLYGASALTAIVVDHVPKKPIEPAMPGPRREKAEVPQIASAAAVCFPVLTEDARVAARDWCQREGGNTSSGHAYVECWNHEPHDQEDDPESFLRWEYTVKDALADDAKKEAELGGQ